MLKAVTFKAAQNFKANLYALEVRSRFTDQSKANGYYNGYGNSLSATVVGTSGIKIGSGAFVVQGRMVEVVSSETVSIAYQEGKVGYIVCRIETCPATNAENCSLVARVGSSLAGISLTQENTYAYESESTNRVYELPLYSFVMQNSAITSVTRIIEPIIEFTELAAKIEEITRKADAAIDATNKFYPVGSIYMSVTNTSPASFFGGTWVAWGTGRVPVGINTGDSNFNTVEKTGGTSAHTLTISEMPSHKHGYVVQNRNYNARGLNIPAEQGSCKKNAAAGSDLYALQPTFGGDEYDAYGYFNISASGGGGAHNNLQPYIVCYMWKRIA